MKILESAYQARSSKVNKIEKVKALKTPLEAVAQLEQYAASGYASIPDEDKSYFLKCFGVFDRPQTPEKFMMRVRIPGGQLSSDQAYVLGECAKEFGQDYIDITTRQQIEFRYLDIKDIPTIFGRMKSVGISSYQTGVDNFRNILNDPLDGDGFDNILPSQALLEKLQSKFLNNPEWISALPRKFNTAVCGSVSNRSNVFGQDCCFILAQKDGVYGYNLYLGGKVGQIAKNANMFLKDEDEVEACYDALIELFKRFGFRDNRNKNRLYFLIQSVGMQALSDAIREYSGKNFATAGETLTQLDFSDPDQGKIALRDGSFGVHVVVPSGIFSGSALIDAADAAKTFGSKKIRFTIEQSLYIMGVSNENLSSLLQHRLFDTFKSVHTPYFNHLIACAGTEHCPFGVIPNKPDAIEMAEYLSEAVPLEEGRIRMYWSACVKGCGIHGVGDIGFEGCKAKVDGNSEYGVHISVGGKLTGEGVEGHSVMKAVPLRFAKNYVETLALEYRRMKEPVESFEKFYDRILSRYSRAGIGFIMQLLAYTRTKNISLDFGFESMVKTGTNEEFEIFEFGRKLYYLLMEEEAYTDYGYFTPPARARLKPLIHSEKELDENLAAMIYKMIDPVEESRAKVFSELQSFISLY